MFVFRYLIFFFFFFLVNLLDSSHTSNKSIWKIFISVANSPQPEIHKQGQQMDIVLFHEITR